MSRAPITVAIRPRDWVLLGLCAGILVCLDQAIAPERPLAAIDRTTLDWLGSVLSGPLGDFLVQVYRLSGIGFTAILVTAALIYLILHRWWRDLRLLVMASGGILILVDLLFKPLFSRNRPPGSLLPVDGYSFPSGHAAGAIAFYFALVIILSSHHPHLRRSLGAVAALWVGLVWLSTLYVRAHWPTDLVAGAAVGLGWLTVCLVFWRDSPGTGVQSGPHPPPIPR